MIKIFTLFTLLLATVFGRATIQPVNKPTLDLCPTCVNFMGQAIDNLLNILLNVGVVGSCGDLCGKLPNQYEALACDLLCDYVGITGFIDAIQTEDPDPIYICQLIDVCKHVEGGKVNITSTSVRPKDGRQGTTFTLAFEYDVLSQTSVGGIDVTVLPPAGFPIGGGSFTEGQAPGHYRFEATLQAKPTEDDPFMPGLYKVIYAVCAGDCSTKHPYGGVYAQAQNTFTLSP